MQRKTVTHFVSFTGWNHLFTSNLHCSGYTNSDEMILLCKSWKMFKQYQISQKLLDELMMTMPFGGFKLVVIWWSRWRCNIDNILPQIDWIVSSKFWKNSSFGGLSLSGGGFSSQTVPTRGGNSLMYRPSSGDDTFPGGYCQNPNSTISSIQLSLRLDYILTQRSTHPPHHKLSVVVVNCPS